MFAKNIIHLAPIIVNTAARLLKMGAPPPQGGCGAVSARMFRYQSFNARRRAQSKSRSGSRRFKNTIAEALKGTA